jgi:hypothetical protein
MAPYDNPLVSTRSRRQFGVVEKEGSMEDLDFDGLDKVLRALEWADDTGASEEDLRARLKAIKLTALEVSFINDCIRGPGEKALDLSGNSQG